MLDREFSALIGVTTSIRDEDITVPLPSEIDSSLNSSVMSLQITASRLTSDILTSM